VKNVLRVIFRYPTWKRVDRPLMTRTPRPRVRGTARKRSRLGGTARNRHSARVRHGFAAAIVDKLTK